MSKQNRKVEWSFDFENMGKQFGQFFKNMAAGGDVELETADLAAALDGAASAQVEIDFSVGRAAVAALAADSDNLFEAQITYAGEYEFEVSGGAERHIALRQKGRLPSGIGRRFSHAKSLEWHIALAQNIPCSLSLKGGLGETDIDLTQLAVDAIKLGTGVGKVALTLSSQGRRFHASISGGVGKTDVTVPAGASGDLKIDGGVGEVKVLVAPNAAVRIKASSGLGRINLPPAFARVSGGGDFPGAGGIWESPDFADAKKQTVIDYNGGVGNFHLKRFDVL